MLKTLSRKYSIVPPKCMTAWPMWTISVADADAVDAKQAQRFAMEQQLQQAHLVAENLTAGDFTETGNADFV